MDEAKAVAALVQQVVRETYLTNIQRLRFHADKVRFYNDTKRQLRAELRRLRSQAGLGSSDERASTPLKFGISEEDFLKGVFQSFQ